MSTSTSHRPGSATGHGPPPQASSTPSPRTAVVPINESASLFLALADDIRGTAVGLSPAGMELLRDGLETRFGPLFPTADTDVFQQLVRLAVTPAA